MKKFKIASLAFVLLIFCLGQIFTAPCGDVNSNGVIDIIDALMTAQYCVGLNPSGFISANADVNGDNSVSIVDALLIAQYYVGLISGFTGCVNPTSPPVQPTHPPTSPPAGSEDLYAINWSLSGTIDVHDPVIIKEQGTWYIFHTGNEIAIKTSSNGTSWSNAGTVFDSLPSWHYDEIPLTDRNTWAPDIFYYNGTYYLYYSVSSFGSNRSAIGMATRSSLGSGGWSDQGPVFQSYNSDDYNAIDPNIVLDNNGEPWMSFGSFWGGIKLIKLDPGSMRPASDAQLYSIAYNSTIEAPFIVERNNYFYLFISRGYCCRGVDSTYRILVGRSTNITGAYTDRNGNSLMNGGGTLIDDGDSRYIGPGHCAVYQSTGTDTWILVNHAYDAHANGAARLQIRPLYWDSSGWPNL